MRMPGKVRHRITEEDTGCVLRKPWVVLRGFRDVDLGAFLRPDPCRIIDRGKTDPTQREEGGETSQNGKRRIVRDSLVLRHWTATELDAAIRLAGGMRLAARHGSFEPEASFDGSPGEWRMISVLQRAR